MNFKSQNNEIYNKYFNLDEWVEAIQLSHDSTTGSDKIHHQMLKHLSENSLEILLNISNFICTTGKELRALRGKFGPLWSQKLKCAFHQFQPIGLFDEWSKCKILAFVLLLPLLW